jgi:hypothetical protein
LFREPQLRNKHDVVHQPLVHVALLQALRGVPEFLTRRRAFQIY